MSKLPTMMIKNPFSASPKIKAKVNKLWLTIRVFVISSLLVIFSSTGYWFNLQREIQQDREKLIASEIKNASTGSGVVVDATASIIMKEGKVPISNELAKKYASWIYDAALKWNIDPILILAVIRTESQFDYKAISSGNAIGMMQVIHYWHKEKASQHELFDPKTNIYVGTQILNEYSIKSNTDFEMLLRYNGSLGKSTNYAVKVLSKRDEYSRIIQTAIINS